MSDFFHCGKDDFGLATLCGCDCTSLNMIPNIWNSCGDNMTNLFEISSFEDYSCSDFLNSIRTTCSGRTIDEIQIEATELLSQFGNANPDEILLINQIIDDVQNNLEVSAAGMREDWHNLSGEYENEYSLIFIEITSSLIDFEENNPEFFEGNNITFIPKVGSIFGGTVLNVLIDVGWDLIEHAQDQQWEYTEEEQVRESFIKGGIAGAIF